jgi:hypothetical protein
VLVLLDWLINTRLNLNSWNRLLLYIWNSCWILPKREERINNKCHLLVKLKICYRLRGTIHNCQGVIISKWWLISVSLATLFQGVRDNTAPRRFINNWSSGHSKIYMNWTLKNYSFLLSAWVKWMKTISLYLRIWLHIQASDTHYWPLLITENPKSGLRPTRLSNLWLNTSCSIVLQRLSMNSRTEPTKMRWWTLNSYPMRDSITLRLWSK